MIFRWDFLFYIIRNYKMKVPTNLVVDAVRYYKEKLSSIYPVHEAQQMVYLLLEDFFGFTRINLAMKPDLRLSESEMLELHFAVKDLLKHKPLQYVSGKAWFYGRVFSVNEQVLIPRHETELLVEEVLAFLKERKQKKVLDLGTGSGCIAVSIALEDKAADLTAVDISQKAIEMAAHNADALGAHVHFIEGSIFNRQLFHRDTRFDVIASNPPYVTDSEKSEMRNNVIEWEPHAALFVPDEDPLLFYKEIAVLAQQHLVSGGLLALEINERFGQELADLLQESGFSKVQLQQDIHKKDRLLSAIR